MKDSFIFYRNFYECIEKLQQREQLAAYKAICRYALDGLESSLKGTAQIIYEMAKPNIDSNNKKYKNGCKGGRPADDDSPRKELEDIKLVNLTETQYNRLIEKYGEKVLIKAIEELESWLDTGIANISKAAKAALGKNHYCYFKKDSWIIQKAMNQISKENQANRPNYGI